jgi:methionyl-tRNA formyltransferase
MRVLFWGTPQYAVPTLKALHAAGHEVLGVVTQPDRRRGRGKQLMPSPVKQVALELDIPVFTPERIRRDLECQLALKKLNADLSIVVAFGQILPSSVLEQPPLGCWNGHGSLLPRWRGAGPIQWCLLEGDQETGVGVMAMEEGLDTGPVLLERRCRIGLLETAEDLAVRLSAVTAELMLEALPLIASVGPGPQEDRLQRLGVTPQQDRNVEVTYARMLTKEDLTLNWSESALALHRRVMALHPNAFTRWRGQRLKLLRSEPLIERLRDELSEETRGLVGRWPTGTTKPGTVLSAEPGLGLVVSTRGCPLLIRAAQLEGKARSDSNTLLQQLRAQPGDQLGDEIETIS